MIRPFVLALALFAAPTLAAAQTPPVAACGAVTRGAPSLTSYDELSTPGRQFRVRLRYDETSHAWTPAPALRMPLHHASSIEYDVALPPASSAELELVIVSVDRRLVSFEAGVRTWFFAYRVRVVSACTRERDGHSAGGREARAHLGADAAHVRAGEMNRRSSIALTV